MKTGIVEKTLRGILSHNRVKSISELEQMFYSATFGAVNIEDDFFKRPYDISIFPTEDNNLSKVFSVSSNTLLTLKKIRLRKVSKDSYILNIFTEELTLDYEIRTPHKDNFGGDTVWLIKE